MDFANIFGDIFDHTAARIVLTILVVLILQLMLRQTIGHVVRRLVRTHKYESHADEQKRENTLVGIFRTANAVLLWLVGIIVILGQLNVNVATLVTGAGLIGVLVGFGAQSAIKDFLAGIFVISENQYRIGDIVSFSAGGSNVAGVVEDITIRITRLRDLDGITHIVPNGEAGIVSNLSFKFANVNVDVGVSYDSDIDKVEKIMNEVGAKMAAEEAWQADTIEPIQFLRVDSFGDSSITIKALGKVKPARQWDIAGEFRRRIKVAFEKNGIEIPLPQVVVHQPRPKSKA